MGDIVDRLRFLATRNLLAASSSELKEAANEIERLRAEVVRIHSDRQYIIGFNDGFDSAVEQSAPQRLRIVDPH